MSNSVWAVDFFQHLTSRVQGTDIAVHLWMSDPLCPWEYLNLTSFSQIIMDFCHFLAWLYFSPQGQCFPPKMNYISPQKWIILTPKCTEHWMKHWFFRSRGLNSSPVICNVMSGHRGGEKCINIIRYSLRRGIQRSMKVKGGWVNRRAGVEQQSTQQLVSRPSDIEFHFCSLADVVLFFCCCIRGKVKSSQVYL